MPGTSWSFTSVSGRIPNRSIPRRERPSRRWNPAELDPAAAASASAPTSADVHAVVAATILADSIRRYGHLAAQLDPLGSTPPGDPSLSPATHGITDDDLKRLPAIARGRPRCRDIVDRVRGDRKASPGVLLDHRLRLRARLRARRARLAAARGGVGTLPAADRSGEH